MGFGTVGEVTTGDPATLSAAADPILDVTAELLGSKGYDALQLRDVAREARVSLSTIYKRFPSRDDLVIAAVERWMAVVVYTPELALREGETLPGYLIRSFGLIFEPWRKNPTMLNAFLRAAVLPGGERFGQQGAAAVGGPLAVLFPDEDPEVLDDLDAVLPSLVAGLLARFASGEIDVDEIIRVYERAVRRLTQGAAAEGDQARTHGTPG